MSTEQLGVYAGIVLSLLFSYVPGLSDWYAALSGTYKRLLMLGLLAVVAGGALAVSCLGVKPLVTCDEVGMVSLVETFIAAAIANQATYTLSPNKPQ